MQKARKKISYFITKQASIVKRWKQQQNKKKQSQKKLNYEKDNDKKLIKQRRKEEIKRNLENIIKIK